MKKITFIFLLMISSCLLVAQEKDSISQENIAFAIIDQSPIYPGCEKLEKSLQKLCLQNQIKKYVNKKFKVRIAGKLELQPGVKKIYVQFKIDKNGDITDVRARGPHKKLEKEAIRVIKSLPSMVPGKNNNRTVGVKYTLPITLFVK